MIRGGRCRKSFSNAVRYMVSTIHTRRTRLAHCVRFEPLNQDAVEEWYDCLDAFESCLRSLQDTLTVVSWWSIQ